MEQKIEHIIEKEFENGLNSNNLDLVEPLKEYISNGKSEVKRNMASSILSNISKYHLLEDTFDFFIDEARKEKSNHLKSVFLSQLQGLQSNSNSVKFLIDITSKRNVIPKRSAYRALQSVMHKSIENHVLDKVQIEKDNSVIKEAVCCLTINGTKKSINPLIELFKKSRDGSIRGHIVQVLEHIINRENLTEDEIHTLAKFSEKSKIGFENIWKGPPNIITKLEVVEQAEIQLKKNKLNLEFRIDENFKASINIDKMKRNYLRFLNYSIKSLQLPVFYKDLMIHSFGTGTGWNYTEFLNKHDEMRPDEYIFEILDKIKEEIIPAIFDIHLGAKKVLSWDFEKLIKNYSEIIDYLKIKHDHIELQYFVQFSTLKKGQDDYQQYLVHCLKLWENVKHFKDYRTREYLLSELNTVGNMA